VVLAEVSVGPPSTYPYFQMNGENAGFSANPAITSDSWQADKSGVRINAGRQVLKWRVRA